MTLFQAIVLGVLQGLSEFLPISSSAHLALAPWLLGWPDPGLGFDVALHVGTLLAVLWYFRAEWVRLTLAGIRVIARRSASSVEEKRAIYLVVATVPAAVAGLLLNRLAERAFRAPALIAAALIVMGTVLWLVDRTAGETRPLQNLRARDAILVGLAQVFALVPGVSRSGATITAGRALQLDRESAAVFSFLMSMPIIAAAAAFEVPKLLQHEGLSAPLVAGLVASALSGWVAIAVLLRFVARHSYGVFALYRVILGVVVLALAAARS